MDESSPQQLGLVRYSPLAAEDFAENYNSTAHLWGLDQAERYADLLEKAAQAAADNPSSGKPIIGHPVARARFVKWPKAKYGHYIVYRPTATGIYVLRILHSAMNIADHLAPEHDS